MTDISRWIERHAGFQPDKIALRFQGEETSYAELATQIDAAARALTGRLGLKRGDRIAWLGYNAPEMIVLLFAAARTGLIFVPLNWRLAAPEHRHILADCGASVLFATRDFAAGVAAALPAGCKLIGVEQPIGGNPSLAELLADSGRALDRVGDASRPLLIVYTSGTTGQPKGAVLTQEALLWNALNSVHMHDMRADDHVLTVLPMFHVGGLNIQTTPALYMGATVTLHPRFEPGATLQSFAVDRPTLTVQVPATMQALIAHPGWASAGLSSLRAVATGSTDVPLPLIEAFHARKVPVIQIYGSTETGPVAIYQRGEDAVATAGSIGRRGLHTEIRIVDGEGHDVAQGTAGEVLVRGKHVASGYWNAPETSAKTFDEGWFRSGDIALEDEHGWFWFKDRIRNVIISGGENVYPAELERVLRDVPGVVEAAVVARPDARWGAVPVAVVVRDKNSPIDRADVLAAFEGRLARYKHPKDVIFTDALPRNAMGKVRIEEVGALAQGAHAAAS
ncbi:MAG TPA: AMP-binding protein [Xanthobacteraceae bacterium]|nr:AMP-binding protein [Xanthobacteraceae bacterium]